MPVSKGSWGLALRYPWKHAGPCLLKTVWDCRSQCSCSRVGKGGGVCVCACVRTRTCVADHMWEAMESSEHSTGMTRFKCGMTAVAALPGQFASSAASCTCNPAVLRYKVSIHQERTLYKETSQGSVQWP